MGLQIITGASGSGKSYYVSKWIIDESQKNKNSMYVMTVPEQFTMQTQRNIVNMHPAHGVMNIDILSFERLAYKIFEELSVELLTVLDDSGKTLLIKKVLEQNKDKLLVYKKSVDKIGFVDNMKSLIAELLQYDITREEYNRLIEETNNKNLLNSKLKDIGLVMEEFKKACGGKYVPTEDILKLLCQYIDKSELVKKSIFVFDGFTGFTPVQYKVLELLMIYSKDVIVTTTIRSNENYNVINGAHELFYLSKDTILRLRKIADKNRISVYDDIAMKDAKPVRFSCDELAFLENNIFAADNRTFDGKCENINVFEAFNPQEEINYVVGEIKKLIGSGYRFRDIAVVSGDSDGYADKIKRSFEQNGITTFIDDKKGVISNPLVELIRSSILIAIEDFSYDSVIRLLKTRLAKENFLELDIFENYIIAFGIKGHKRYKSEWNRLYKGIDEKDLIIINRIRKEFLDNYEALYKVLTGKKASCSDYINGIYEYLEKLDVYGGIEELLKETAEGTISQKEFESIYDQVMNVFDKIEELVGEERLSLEEFLGVLEAGFEQIKISIIPPVIDSVTVGDIERSRLDGIKVLFFIGVNDGIIPKNDDGVGILSDFDRENIKKSNINLAPTKRENTYIEKFYLYLNMTKPSDKLYISYYKFDFEGKTTGKSYLVGNMLNMFPDILVRREGDIENFDDYIFKPVSKYEKEQSEIINMSQNLSSRLYGQELKGSVSRIEKYMQCSYEHFLEYGLRLEPRKEHEITSKDIGIIYHNVLEIVTKEIEKNNYTYSTLPDDVREDIVSKAVMSLAQNDANVIMNESEKNKYILEMMKKVISKTVWAIGKQLEKGMFSIAGYETSFGPYKTSEELRIALPNNSYMDIEGRIDRIDTCTIDDKEYVKIIDYKTSDSNKDLSDIYYGLSLQLPVYMKAAILMEKKKDSTKTVLPAAFMYNVLSNPLIKEEDSEKTGSIEKTVLIEMRPKGFVNNTDNVLNALDDTTEDGASTSIPVRYKAGTVSVDNAVSPEVFELIPDYAINKIKKAATEIVSGNIEVLPYKKGTKTPCEYCNYKSICPFELSDPKYKYRKINMIDEETFREELLGGDKDAKMDE